MWTGFRAESSDSSPNLTAPSVGFQTRMVSSGLCVCAFASIASRNMSTSIPLSLCMGKCDLENSRPSCSAGELVP